MTILRSLAPTIVAAVGCFVLLNCATRPVPPISDLPELGTAWKPCVKKHLLAPIADPDAFPGVPQLGSVSDRENAAVSRRVPGGFAGFWLSREQRLQIALVDTARADQARRGLRALLKPLPQGQLSVINDSSIAKGVAVTVPWSYAELYDWKRYFASLGLVFPSSELNLATTSVDVAHNRILYMASDSLSYRRVRAILSKVRIPCGVVAVAHGTFTPLEP